MRIIKSEMNTGRKRKKLTKEGSIQGFSMNFIIWIRDDG